MDFTQEIYNDVTVETVNMERATMKEALEFKDILLNNIDNGCRKLIIDLSSCAFIDSTFLGSLVVVMKKMKNAGGEIILVSPKSFAYDMLQVTGTLKLFSMYILLKEALAHFDVVFAEN